ncbi:MAG: hypothetical protein IKT46_00390 [Clostridia bacterium]|nr:hypothetical protein [Clostridia bacterium]
MKRIVLVIVSCLLFLCSCSANATYKNHETINMNYNNITNYCDVWLTSDSICYLEHSIGQKYYMVDNTSKTKISENGGYGFGMIRRYDDNIYMLNETSSIDEYNSEFELVCYDVNTKNTEKLCSVKNCDNFLVLHKTVYYLEYNLNNEYRVLTLKKIPVNSKQDIVIASNVVSFGVIDNCLYYIAEDNGTLSVMKYNAENDDTVECGDISIDGFDIKNGDTLKASFTADCIYLLKIDYTRAKTRIFKYSFEQDTLSDNAVDGYIDSFASYDANSYFIVSSEKSDNSKLYMLNNKTDEATKIADVLGEGSLFVGSDDGVYVLRQHNNSVVFYSNDGTSQVVYRF